jgi:hypothetical protein
MPVATDRAKALIEQSEGRRLCDEALREIELGRSTFVDELARIRDAKKIEKDGPGGRHWTAAERLLKKAEREGKIAKQPLQQTPLDESEAL